MFARKYNSLQVRLGCLLGVISLSVSMLAAAEGRSAQDGTAPNEEESTVKLVATINDNPAFTEVTWRLYRAESPSSPIRVIPRHTAIVYLEPGRYLAVASLKSVERKASFELQPYSVEEVILSMDK